jgi:type II secretory pathway component GspD/PulD (secretin)
MLKALKTFGETRLLSDPRLTVQDGHEATLEVVTSEAYEAGTSEVDSGGVTTSYRNFEFIDVGVSLSVIPKINDEGFVNMLIKPEVSSVISWYGGASGPAEERSAGAVPIVKRSTAETTVTVKDGVTIVIGGLIDESTVSTEQKVPILGNIPLLKYLFRRTSDSTERRETIIFLTPHIVTGDRSMPWDTYEEKQIKGLRE